MVVDIAGSLHAWGGDRADSSARTRNLSSFLRLNREWSLRALGVNGAVTRPCVASCSRPQRAAARGATHDVGPQPARPQSEPARLAPEQSEADAREAGGAAHVRVPRCR